MTLDNGVIYFFCDADDNIDIYDGDVLMIQDDLTCDSAVEMGPGSDRGISQDVCLVLPFMNIYIYCRLVLPGP